MVSKQQDMIQERLFDKTGVKSPGEADHRCVVGLGICMHVCLGIYGNFRSTKYPWMSLTHT